MIQDLTRPQLFQSQQYLEALVTSISQARSSICIATMTFRTGYTTACISDALLAALDRHVRITMYIDVYSRLFYNPMPVMSPELRLLSKLRDKGADIIFCGEVKMNPFKGRFHHKAVIIDDIVFSFGGINLKEGAFQAVDLMIGWRNHQVAEGLRKHLRLNMDNNAAPIDSGAIVENLNSVLFDRGGTGGNSTIYEKALELVRNADKVSLVSRMSPSGELAEALAAKNAPCYFNTITEAGPATKLSLMIDRLKTRIPNSYDRSGYLHAKYLMFTLKDGKNGIMTGSHNFNHRGVIYGTREIALLSFDNNLYMQFKQFHERYVMNNTE